MSISSTIPNKTLYTVGLGLGVTLLSYASYWYYKYWRRYNSGIPQKWRRIGKLADANVYPLKSGHRLEMDPKTVYDCDNLGLKLNNNIIRDRILMVVDENDKIVTCRTYPRMVLIAPRLVGPTRVAFSHPDMKLDIEFDFADIAKYALTSEDVTVSIWGSKATVKRCTDELNQWFSQCIIDKDEGLRLVYYPHNECVRNVVPSLAKLPFIRNEDSGTFNDATSFMLMNLASVEDVNKRLPAEIDPIQYRAGFHVRMDKDVPYAEDNWKWVKIGNNAIFRVIAPCARCIVPNVDPFKGERLEDFQPLRTLKNYRMWQGYESPILGIHLGLRQPGKVKVNDIVYIQE